MVRVNGLKPFTTVAVVAVGRRAEKKADRRREERKSISQVLPIYEINVEITADVFSTLAEN